MVRHKHLPDTHGNCEVVVAHFVFGSYTCDKVTEEKLWDPIDNVSRWVCPEHKASLSEGEGGEDDGISEPQEELHSDQGQGSPGDEARDYC